MLVQPLSYPPYHAEDDGASLGAILPYNAFEDDIIFRIDIKIYFLIFKYK
jgi:hypothetical protein